MTWKFNRILAVIELHVRAKLYQAECNNIALTEKKDKKNKLRDDDDSLIRIANLRPPTHHCAIF